MAGYMALLAFNSGALWIASIHVGLLTFL